MFKVAKPRKSRPLFSADWLFPLGATCFILVFTDKMRVGFAISLLISQYQSHKIRLKNVFCMQF